MLAATITGASGRMGKELIQLIANNPDFKLVGAVETKDHPAVGDDAGLNAGLANLNIKIADNLSQQVISQTDVVIDFSTPEATLSTISMAVKENCGVVVGTTGFSEDEKDLIKNLASQGGRIVLAPNMSIGINLLFRLCREAAKILGQEYDVEIVEMHHRQKKDAPSGTAVKLGEIIAAVKNLTYLTDARHGRSGLVGKRTNREIGMHSVRGGDVVGDHQVIFAGDGERIELVHKASRRTTFAKGALCAAKFLKTAEPGLYSMEDVLDFG